MTGVAPRLRLPHGIPEADQIIASRAQLIELVAAGAKDESSRLLGIESERVPLRADGRAAPYEGDGPCVRDLLRWLVDARGWEPVQVDGRLLSLDGELGAVYLEPGAQLELALPPVRTATEVHERLASWQHQLADAAEATGVHAVSIGLQPVTPIRDVQWIPRRRYEIMGHHLGERGRLGHHMMKGSAGVQVNVDYTSETDAASLVRTALLVSPVVNALVANSPLEEGAANGFLTKRPRIWLDTDPDRCGVLPWVMNEGFTFERYVDWALDVPVMFLMRSDNLEAIGDRTFRQLLADGHPEHGRVTFADFALHLTSLFPEVRVKQHVEIRGADACSLELIGGLTALWRAVLYDEVTRTAAGDLLPELTGAELAGFHEEVGLRGLAARCQGRTARDLAQDLLALAAAGLERLSVCCGVGSEASLLAPLEAIVASGRTPAEGLLDDWHAHGVAALLARG